MAFFGRTASTRPPRAGLWLPIGLCACLVLCASIARADAVVLLGEAYGRYGSLSPTGHAAIYLTRVCAASPLELRRCGPGERGVVISRYHRVGGVDWIAVPILPYLYGVDRAADVPAVASLDEVQAIRDRYRRAHFASLVPDAPDGSAPPGNWFQLVGAAYDRRLLAFSMPTTAAQDDDVIAAMNAASNRARFNIVTRNCADFVRDVLHLYYPKFVSDNWIADLGVTTPKQIARAVVKRGNKQPELAGSAFIIPQIPGNRPPSRPARGVLESLVRTKKYAIPLTVVQPWVAVGVAAGYLSNGRFDPHQHALGRRDASDFDADSVQVADAAGEVALSHLQ